MKHKINPQYNSGRDTLCQNLRYLWRLGERVGGEDGAAIQDLSARCFDFAKRMNNRLKEYKEKSGDPPSNFANKLKEQKHKPPYGL